MTWPASVPIWLIGLVTLAVMMVGAIAGEILKRRRSGVRDEDASSKEGYVVSGVVGLLALLLGFTFALAVDRFETRRMLVVEEASAIRTAYRQAQTFPPPHNARLRVLLARYVDNRLMFAPSGDRGAADRMLGSARELRRQLWAATLVAVELYRDDVASTFMGSMSDVLRLGAERRAARATRVPASVFLVLYIYMFVAAMVLGLVIGPKQRGVVFVLLALTTLSLTLIIDVDNYAGGSVSESQLPLEELRDMIAEEPPV